MSLFLMLMNQKVLCVTPIELDYALMSDAFDLFGFTSKWATSDRMALETVRNERQNLALVVVDDTRPVNAYLVAKRIREIDHHIPVIAIGLDRPEWYRQAIIDAGCKEYASKPVGEHYWIYAIGEYTT